MTVLWCRNWLVGRRLVASVPQVLSKMEARSPQTLYSTKASIPSLPVPSLEATMTRYLKSVRPLLSMEEYTKTESLVAKFSGPGGKGEKLQKILEDRASKTENWLEEWWLRSAYLDYRWPVVIYSSPGLVFPQQKFDSLDDQLRFAAKLIMGALDYKINIDEWAENPDRPFELLSIIDPNSKLARSLRKKLPLETIGNQPLDMSQYFQVLSTCRIPGIHRDRLVHYSERKDPPKHIVVAYNNQFFRVPVYDEEGKPHSERQILVALHQIVSMSPVPSFPVGILTTENRNVWGQAYEILMQENVNQASIKEIQKCIFLVCLDGPSPNVGAVNEQTAAALQMIHGGGSKANSGNRWYDKCIQFIIGSKGEVGLTYEHSPAEGVSIAQMMDHIMDYVDSGEQRWLDTVVSPSVDRLVINAGKEIVELMKRAKANLNMMVADLEMTCFTFDKFGKNFIKHQKVSPDSFIQMAIQLAFYRIHDQPGATYESASLRKFKKGRTETIRSCSEEATEFCKAILDPREPGTKKVELLRKAIQAHQEYSKAAMNGKGVDRHLLGLKMAAIENGMDVPRLFLDTGYIRSSHMRLSTSQVPAKCDAFMCYGPLTPDGYGVCYNPRKESMNFGISAMNSSPDTHSSNFRQALEDSLTEMGDLLVKHQPAKL